MKKLLLILICIPLLQYGKDTTLYFLQNKLSQGTADTHTVNELLSSARKFTHQGNISNSAENARLALLVSQRIDYKPGEARSNARLGWCYKVLGFHDIAMEYQWKALRLFEVLNDSNGIANTNLSIAAIYMDQLNIKEAGKFLNSAKHMFQIIDGKLSSPKFCSLFGHYYLELNNTDSALKYYQLSLALNKQNNDDYTSASYGDIASLYRLKKNYPLSLKYLDSARNWAIQSNFTKEIANSYYQKAITEMEMGNLKSAKTDLDSSMKLLTNMKYLSGIAKTYEAYSEFYEKSGNMALSLKNYKLYILNRDSIINEENKAKYIEQKLAYDYEKKAILMKNEQKIFIDRQTQRTRFMLLLFASVALFGLLFLFYYKRKQQLLRKIQLEQARNKISRDLHDELGSNLSSISMQASVIKRKLNRQEDVQDIVENISTASQDMVSKMSDIVWSLQTENENANHFIERISNYCAITLPDNNIQFEIKHNLGNTNIDINSSVLKELYLIAKEAINNSLKHAQCKKITIDFTLVENNFCIQLSDDGKGFDINKPSRTMGGNGLKNMKQRAGKSKAQFSINTKIHQGTEITIKISI